MQVQAFILLQKTPTETHRSTDHEFRGVAFALEQAQHAMTGVEAGGDLQENLLEQFRQGDGLAAGSSEHGELLHFLADLFGTGARRLEEKHDHADSQAGVQEVVEGKAEKIPLLLAPGGPIEAVQT